MQDADSVSRLHGSPTKKGQGDSKISPYLEFFLDFLKFRLISFISFVSVRFARIEDLEVEDLGVQLALAFSGFTGEKVKMEEPHDDDAHEGHLQADDVYPKPEDEAYQADKAAGKPGAKRKARALTRRATWFM